MAWRALARVSAIVIAVLVTTGIVSTAMLARIDVGQGIDSMVREDDPPISTISPELGVRPLPLVMPGGAMDGLPRDRPITKQDGQRALADALAAVDLLRVWPQLHQAMQVDRKAEFVPNPVSPYRYPALEGLLSRLVSDQAIAEAEPATWVDLSAVLTVNAARPLDDQFVHEASAALAYALLDRVRRIHPTCEAQLQFAHIQSLGMRPDWAGTIREFRRAQHLCGQDPTPLLALGVWQQSAQEPGLGMPTGFPGHTEAAAATRAVFDELDRRFPQLPLGPMGLAEVALQNAEYSDGGGVRPFSARSEYRLALRHLAEARSRSASTDLLVPMARAELGLGRFAEALALAEEFLRASPGHPVGLAVKSKALLSLKEFVALADHAATYPEARLPNGLEVVRRGGGTSFGSSFGTMLSQLQSYRSEVWDVTFDAAGGGGADDFGFLPEHRVFEPSVWHGTELEATSRFLSDDRSGLERALKMPTAGDLNRIGPDGPPSDYAVGRMRVIARDEWHGAVLDASVRERFEARQDLWRWADKWDRAASVTDEWTTLLPEDAFAWDRHGEVAFLGGNHREALRHFARAVKTFQQEPDQNRDPSSEMRDSAEAARLTMVKAGATQEALGNRSQAQRLYVMAGADEPGIARFYADSQLGLMLLQEGKAEPAAKHLTAAVEFAKERDTYFWEWESVAEVRILKGAQENNLALALIRAGRAGEAVPVAEGALSRDEVNPIFLETLAYAQAESNMLPEAHQAYARALEADETNHVARNNYGVALGISGDHAGARKAFEAAIAAQPDYAFAWHNLGVAAGQAPGGTFLMTQAGLRKAASIDMAFRDEQPNYRFDHEVYDAGFDVSRALPPDWSFGGAGTSTPVGLSVAVIAIAALGVARAAFKDALGGRFAEWLADGRRRRGWRRLVRRHVPAWSVLLAGPLVMSVALWKEGRLLVEVLAVVALTTGALLSVVLLGWGTGRRRVYSWAPSLIASGVLLPFGVTFIPMPCGHVHPGRRRWAPAILLGTMAAVLLATAILAPIPVIRFSALAAVTLLACLLLPVRPHDGGFLPRKRWTSLALVPLAVAALALDLSWI